MRHAYLSLLLAMALLAALPATSGRVHGCDYGGAYYPAPPVAYYRPYVSNYSAPPAYYSQRANYSYDRPRAYDSQPPDCGEQSYQRPSSGGYRSEQAVVKPATTVTVSAYDNRFEPKTINIQ